MSTKGPRARCPPAPSRVFSYDGPREASHLPTKPRRLPPPSNLSRVPSAYIIKLASSTEASESIFPPGLSSPHFLFPSSHSPRTHIRPPSHKHYTPTFHDSGSFLHVLKPPGQYLPAPFPHLANLSHSSRPSSGTMRPSQLTPRQT